MLTRWLWPLCFVFMAVTWWFMLGSQGIGSAWMVAVWILGILFSVVVALRASRQKARESGGTSSGESSRRPEG